MDHATILDPRIPGFDIEPISDCSLRVGAVSYLNTKPLIFGLKALAPNLDTTIAPPSTLAEQLHAGRLDVALVPVLEYFLHSDYRLIPASAICGNGRVRSVVLFSNVPIERVRSVCLDPESMTSNALLRVLCRERFGIEPEWRTRPRDSRPADVLRAGECDAALVIGNNALSMSERFPAEYDLGQEWFGLTGLPFVFAVWAVRPGVETSEIAGLLRESLRLGLENLEWIVDDAARSLGLDRNLVCTYLKQMIRYELTDRAWEGMARFYTAFKEMSVIANAPPADLRIRLADLWD